MLELFKGWYDRYFSEPEAALLCAVLLLAFLSLAFFGKMLAPCLASIVIAYLLEASVSYLQASGLRRFHSVCLVFGAFLLTLVFLLVGLVPLVSTQLTSFAQDLPETISSWRAHLMLLPDRYPNLLTSGQIDSLMSGIKTEISQLGQNALTFSIASIPAIVTILIYFVLGPVLVFFFLKDKSQIVAWFTTYLPRDRAVLRAVWRDVDDQIGNYVRGKVYEIFIVGFVSFLAFHLLGMSYAPLLAVITGISVIIPFIGAAIATIPVAIAAYIQFGFSGDDFVWVMMAYAVIQLLDGNLLVPLLFSDVVNLHPVAIITAVLVFGGLWGVWGVFFAIPLATLVRSLLKAWPKKLETPPT